MNKIKKMLKYIGAVMVVLGTTISTFVGVIWFGFSIYDIFYGGVNIIQYTITALFTLFTGLFIVGFGAILSQINTEKQK